jgi:hypothetical protein
MTTAATQLGRLEPVDLREVWPSEGGDFTPWLARPENIELLGDAIGLELEVEGQEKDVGPFRADVLCKDTATNNWVLVENQLERTDHTHLGQLLTYAAGLQAVTIVWVAQRFTDEHRAALDWLNEITDGRFNFFGLEIELWRIGGSPVAPKFNVVCQPNDWTQTVSQIATSLDARELTDTKRLQLEFWTAFRKLLLERGSRVRGTKPLPQNWNNFAIGRSDVWLETIVNTRDKRLAVALALGGPQARAHFDLLHQERPAVEAEIGQGLDWHAEPGKKQCRVFLRREDTDPALRDQWPEQQEWLREKLELFHRVFSGRVKYLDRAADDGSDPAEGST